MINRSLFKVQPLVSKYLGQWRKMAGDIPDPELRRQAILSLDTKAFHCQGGAILGLLAADDYREAIKFIVAYQTISDYLDNLCDRSTSQDPADFTALHESMSAALGLQEDLADYYRYHPEREDGGYLAALVGVCREVILPLPGYKLIVPAIAELSRSYCELQVYKHVATENRLPLLTNWFARHRDRLAPMSWFEFAASTGSTLGIFALVSSAFHADFTEERAKNLQVAYFPWVQGLHILLDYLIDQEEDRQGGDLNFCSFYQSAQEMEARIVYFYRQAREAVKNLPAAPFHLYVIRGLIGTYLADRKAARQSEVKRVARRLLSLIDWQGMVLFLHCLVYRRLK